MIQSLLNFKIKIKTCKNYKMNHFLIFDQVFLISRKLINFITIYQDSLFLR